MTNPNALLHRRDVVNELVRDRADLLVIAGLGAPNWMSPPPAIMPTISRSGARWAAPP